MAYLDSYIQIKAKKHNRKLVKKVKEDDRIKYIIMNLKEWLGKFKGIATKYLEGYLSFFVLFNLDKEMDYIDIVSYLSFKNIFIKTKEISIQELKL